MLQVIIYRQDNGVPAIVCPTPEALARGGIVAIARKDVPAGKRYKIMNYADLPSDWGTQGTWQVDDADLTDGVGDVSNEFPQELQP